MGPAFAEPRDQFSMANIHGRLYALAGRKNNSGSAAGKYHLDGVVLRQDMGGWDLVPDLVFPLYFNSFVMIPYNL